RECFVTTLAQRVARLPWPELQAELDARGFAQTPAVLAPDECRALAGLYETGAFRSTVTMARHGFGQGEYRYFDHPLPEPVRELRSALYPPLAEAANRWAEILGEDGRYPAELDAFLARCHAAGQARPTPLLLRYGPGDWNALHQDVYGDVAFPLQAVALLDRPGVDFDGGEFVLAEHRPRAQTRAHVQQLRQGAFLLFTTRQRPARGTRGYHRTAMRHGVSTLIRGRRTTLGVIFHTAR
ncbi:MAG TPA: 2OG-Fe(II) oxygenase, partial [Solirubrobacteraceae bacterium]|nr:2OG-Fe(II) oxygenase [Solirubrobacteraceae bacterium]